MKKEQICQNIPPEIRPEIETLADAVTALKAKIEEQLPTYNNLPLAQLLTTTQGEKALKANPALQEFRATVRDYAQALESLHKIIEKYSTAAPKEAPKSIVGNSKWKIRNTA